MFLVCSFELPPTLNDQIDQARKNRFSSSKTKGYWTDKVAKAVRRQSDIMFPDKVWMAGLFQVKNYLGRDPVDNTPAGLKYVLDGLKTAKVIKDDSGGIIQCPWLHFWEKADPDLGDSVVLLIADHPLINPYLGIDWLTPENQSFEALVAGAKKYATENPAENQAATSRQAVITKGKGGFTQECPI